VEVFPDLILILCPRHLDRLEQVEGLLRREKRPWVRRTALSRENPFLREGKIEKPPVILLDTMGELMKLYSLGTLVFIGGSLVPVGGHNPLEPLWFGKCVLFGPHMFNFREITRLLIEASGAIQVKDGADLLVQLRNAFFRRKGPGRNGARGGVRFFKIIAGPRTGSLRRFDPPSSNRRSPMGDCRLNGPSWKPETRGQILFLSSI